MGYGNTNGELPGEECGNGWRRWKNTRGRSLGWCSATMALLLPPMGGNPVKWGLGRAPGICSICFGARGLILALRSCQGTDLVPLTASSAPCPGLGTLWNVHPEDASHPAGRTSSCFWRAQGFMDFLQQRPGGLLCVAPAAAGISELLPWISCAWGCPQLPPGIFFCMGISPSIPQG